MDRLLGQAERQCRMCWPRREWCHWLRRRLMINSLLPPPSASDWWLRMYQISQISANPDTADQPTDVDYRSTIWESVNLRVPQSEGPNPNPNPNPDFRIIGPSDYRYITDKNAFAEVFNPSPPLTVDADNPRTCKENYLQLRLIRGCKSCRVQTWIIRGCKFPISAHLWFTRLRTCLLTTSNRCLLRVQRTHRQKILK